jgi:hypothetical protein
MPEGNAALPVSVMPLHQIMGFGRCQASCSEPKYVGAVAVASRVRRLRTLDPIHWPAACAVVALHAGSRAVSSTELTPASNLPAVANNRKSITHHMSTPTSLHP